jgi:DNA polymerase-3 subunit delta
MPPAAKPPAVVLVCGDDEFAVKQRSREIYQKWCAELGGMDHEIIDATAGNSGDALKALARLREALQTLPFFGSGKAVWLQNCNFLGEDRTADSRDVTDTLSEIARELKDFNWESVRLLVSSGKVDKRKIFYKTIDQIGKIEPFAGWSLDQKDWEMQAEARAREAFQELKKQISDEALGELVANVGPHPRQLQSEVEKLALYVGNRDTIEAGDVAAISIKNKSARAFALADAFGDRDLPRLLRRLDEELWQMKFDSQKSEIGILYGLISKVRVMILLKEMLREGWIKPEAEYNRFKSQLERIPKDKLPEDKRYNPLAINPFMLFKALPQARRYSQSELVQAMDLLLKCNQRLVSSGTDATVILQQTLIQIVEKPKAVAAGF